MEIKQQILKAQSGDTIELIEDLNNITIFGLLQLPKGTRLEVDYRSRKDTGVFTTKYVRLTNRYSTREVKVRVSDNQYKIIR